MKESVPPLLPEKYRQYPEYWIGSQNPYGPQLSVKCDATAEEVKAAAEASGKLLMRFTYSDITNDKEESNEISETEVFIDEVFSHDLDESVNIMATIRNPFGTALTAVWIWQYTPGELSGADLSAGD